MGGIVVERKEFCESDGVILILVILVKDRRDSRVLFCTGTACCSENEPSYGGSIHESSLFIFVHIIPLGEDLLNLGDEISRLHVNQGHLAHNFRNRNLLRRQNVVILEGQLMQSHSMHVVVENFLVWQRQLDVLGGELEHLRDLLLELPHRC